MTMIARNSSLRNTANPAVFTVKPFKNRNGVVSYRVSGWLLGQRIRRNFKTRDAAIIERGTLQLKQAQVGSSLHIVSTFLTEAQVREAEGIFAKLKEANSPRSLSFYVNYGLTNHHEPKADTTIAEAITAYLAERDNDLKQSLICERQLKALRNELGFFSAYFPQKALAGLTTVKLLGYIRRSSGSAQPSLKTQNNRRAVLFTLCKYACAQGWLAANPLANIKRHRIESCKGSAEALTAAQAAQLMAHVETLSDGAFVPYFALCLFAGIRPEGEISKLPASDVRMDNNAIIIEPWVSKVDMRRIVTIQPNLAAWLRAYPLDQFPIIPPKDKIKNFAGKLSQLRKQFGLGHDVLRHTFISMHVAKFRSIGDTSLQAGNSERIIRKHYLNVTTPQEAEAFFAIAPTNKAESKAITPAPITAAPTLTTATPTSATDTPAPTPTPATQTPVPTPDTPTPPPPATTASTTTENAATTAIDHNTNTTHAPAESHQIAV